MLKRFPYLDLVPVSCWTGPFIESYLGEKEKGDNRDQNNKLHQHVEIVPDFLCNKNIFIQYIVGRSQNLVTLIFTKTTFCQCGNTKCMGHILSNSHSSRPIRTPLKKHQSCFKTLYLWKIPLFCCSFYRATRFCHEKDGQNVVTGWFFMKKLYKMTKIKWNSS